MEYNILVEQAEQVVNEATEPALASALTKVLANTFVFYFKAHSFHWNVVGKDFPQYHEFLGNVYEQAFGSVDRLAEEIRALDAPAPMNLASILKDSSIMENASERDALSMMSILQSDNTILLANLLACQKMAEAANEVGLANYLQDLFDQRKKLAWMLNSILKG